MYGDNTLEGYFNVDIDDVISYAPDGFYETSRHASDSRALLSTPTELNLYLQYNPVAWEITLAITDLGERSQYRREKGYDHWNPEDDVPYHGEEDSIPYP